MKWLKKLHQRLIKRNQVDAIIGFHEGGVYKRIDEGRELLTLLQEKCPNMIETHPWIEGWFKSQDNFLNALAAAGPDEHLFQKKDQPSFPRPWPNPPKQHVIEPK